MSIVAVKNVYFARDPQLFLIDNVKYKLVNLGGEIELAWKWVTQVDGVRIYIFDSKEEITEEALNAKKYIKISKIEFERSMGKYNYKTDRTGPLKIVMLPYYKSDRYNDIYEEVALQIDENGTNILHNVVINKVEIMYRICEKTGFFKKLISQQKEVEVQIFASEAIPPDTLEYTYSGGAFPIVEEIKGEWSISLTEPSNSIMMVRLANPKESVKLYKISKIKEK